MANAELHNLVGFFLVVFVVVVLLLLLLLSSIHALVLYDLVETPFLLFEMGVFTLYHYI